MTFPIPRMIDVDTTLGYWRVWFYPNGAGGEVKDVTFYRDTPTLVSSLSTSDPFGPSTASIEFPAITLLDQIGAQDLWWLRPETDIDIVWLDYDSEQVLYRWSGYAESFEFASTDVGGGLTVTCRGALFQADSWLAKPEYVYQPFPYETAIARQFAGHPDSRLGTLSVQWPTWWTKRFAIEDYTNKPNYLRPVGLQDGQAWSGYVTRSTGSFDPALTSYIQGLLSNMHTEYGQFTVMLDDGRKPVLRHRDHIAAPDASTFIVNVLQPGVKVDATIDYSQRLNVVYGQGKALNGATFSGMRVSADGLRITHEPFAYRNAVHPLELNDWYDRKVMRREVNLSFHEGVSEAEARQIAKSHLQRFADPGVTGSITLTTDPWQNRHVVSRHLVTAGASIQVQGLFGMPEGVLFHVTQATTGPTETTLTIDSKYRDQLTVQEVRARTRDSLAPVRLLTVGQYKPNIPDMLFPWSYADGSGFVPKSSVPLFQGAPDNLAFPWQDWTRQRPPRDPQWRNCYIRIGPASENADDNWANMQGTRTDFKPFPVRMAQAGEASLLQVAAFDQNGSILKIPFHVSIYRTNGVSYSSMPMMGIDDQADNPPYLAGQHYPFFKRAWEQFDENGVALNPETGRAVTTAQLIVGYGNWYEKAGFWPSTSANSTAIATGLLVDEAGFSWDLTDAVYGVDPQRSADENLRDPNRADLQVMVYADAQLEQEVFFLGRIYRKEPGTA